MNVVLDTSPWVRFLREDSGGRAAALDGLLAGQEGVVCGLVVAEILAAPRGEEGPELWTWDTDSDRVMALLLNLRRYAPA